MLRRNIEGLVVIPARLGKSKSLLLSEEFGDLPIVALDRPIEGSRFDALVVENERGARTGTEHLVCLGHKRITFLGLNKDLYTMRIRERGYRKGMQFAGLAPHTIESSDDMESTRAAIRQLLSGKTRPTALFCANNLLTRHVLHALQTMNIHPPKSLALVGFDDFDMADLLRPGITTVRQPVEALGRKAAEMLFERLTMRPGAAVRSARKIVLPVDFVIRGSCGAKM